MVTIVGMDAAQTIRDAVSRVMELRKVAESDPPLLAAVASVKRFQARRFALTYRDLLASGPYQGATRFFLEELYGNRDYSERDAQFARIAGALQRLFPAQAVCTAVSLAKVHALTEELDHEMGQAWLAQSVEPVPVDGLRYVNAWKKVGRPADRDLQLSSILTLGNDLVRLTTTHGLWMMLKLMRRPARLAGLSDLQAFLESGFDTFAKMSRMGNKAGQFLALIKERESMLMGELFSDNPNMATAKFASL